MLANGSKDAAKELRKYTRRLIRTAFPTEARTAAAGAKRSKRQFDDIPSPADVRAAAREEAAQAAAQSTINPVTE